MALILSVNTPLLWLCGIAADGVRQPQADRLAALGHPARDRRSRPQPVDAGDRLRRGLALHRPRPQPVVDRTIELLAQAGSPTALIALGIDLFRFEVKGEKLSILVMCALKLGAMPAAAFLLARLLDLPPVAAGVIVLFAAMPTGANAYIFAVQYQRLDEPGVGRGGAGHAARSLALPVVVWLVRGEASELGGQRHTASAHPDAISAGRRTGTAAITTISPMI